MLDGKFPFAGIDTHDEPSLVLQCCEPVSSEIDFDISLGGVHADANRLPRRLGDFPVT